MKLTLDNDITLYCQVSLCQNSWWALASAGTSRTPDFNTRAAPIAAGRRRYCDGPQSRPWFPSFVHDNNQPRQCHVRALLLTREPCSFGSALLTRTSGMLALNGSRGQARPNSIDVMNFGNRMIIPSISSYRRSCRSIFQLCRVSFTDGKITARSVRLPVIAGPEQVSPILGRRPPISLHRTEPLVHERRWQA